MAKIMRTLSLVALTASLLGLPTTDASAAAEPGFQWITSAPFAACVKASSTGTPTYPWEGLYNASGSQTMTADCSLPLTSDSYQSATYLDTFYVFAYDGHSTNNITCNLQAVNPRGWVDFVAAPKTSSSVGPAFFAFDLPTALWSDVGYVSCNLPKSESGSKSGINSIVQGAGLYGAVWEEILGQ